MNYSDCTKYSVYFEEKEKVSDFPKNLNKPNLEVKGKESLKYVNLKRRLIKKLMSYIPKRIKVVQQTNMNINVIVGKMKRKDDVKMLRKWKALVHQEFL